jgi:hypothetical protein
MERDTLEAPWEVLWVASWPSLRGALRALGEAPREGWEAGELALRHLKRPSPSEVSGLARRPLDPLAWSRPSWEGWLPAAHPRLQREADAALVWAVGRVARRAWECAEWLRARSKSGRSTPAARGLWGWAEAVERDARALEEARRACFLGLEGRPPTEGALLALLDDPGYARAWGLLRALAEPGARGRVPGFVGPSEAARYLYIYRLRGAVGRALEAALGPLGWSALGGRAWEARAAGVELRVEVAPSFEGLGGGRGSLGRGGRAGVVVGWRGARGLGWAWVDAGGLFGAGLDELHRRRGAWVWDGFGGLARGGMLASEGLAADSGLGLARYDLGPAQVRPGEDERALGAWVGRLLGA